MHLIVSADGAVRCLYCEVIDLRTLGRPTIRRGSHVEPDSDGNWIADLSPVSGPSLGPFSSRSQALAAEAAWLEESWVVTSDGQ